MINLSNFDKKTDGKSKNLELIYEKSDGEFDVFLSFFSCKFSLIFLFILYHHG